MEDLDENIRRSSGRDRSLLIKQRVAKLSPKTCNLERRSATQGQEALWAREDTRFQKQEEHVKLVQKLEDDAFARSRAQRETMYKLDMDDLNAASARPRKAPSFKLKPRPPGQFQAEEIERQKMALVSSRLCYGAEKIQRRHEDCPARQRHGL